MAEKINKAENINEESRWQELTCGAEIYEGGTSRLVKTGEWRIVTPLIDFSRCSQCLLCVPFCPDMAIPVENGKRLDTDLYYCKGCGICARVCRAKAIEMGREV